MTDPEGKRSTTTHYFVDEAGDPRLFDSTGRIVVGTEGCSNYFILGTLRADAPDALTEAMERLRLDLLADPYFKGVPSMQPAHKKTALTFHAKDDLPEVRREVFRLLLKQKLRFYAVVRDKRQAAAHETRLRENDPRYRYRPNDLYDGLVSHLFRTRCYRSEQLRICFSKRGKSDRTQAMRRALAKAIDESERDFGVKNATEVEITHSAPTGSGGLQAVDYLLWAVQRFYEFEATDRRESECRYVEMIREVTCEINDLDYLYQGKRGMLWGPERPLSLAGRIQTSAKKEPGI